MSESVLRILLGEVSTVRLICNQCKGVVEVQLEKLEDKDFLNGRCKLCGVTYREGNTPNTDPLQHFATAYSNLLKIRKVIEVELVLPQPTNTENN